MKNKAFYLYLFMDGADSATLWHPLTVKERVVINYQLEWVTPEMLQKVVEKLQDEKEPIDYTRVSSLELAQYFAEIKCLWFNRLAVINVQDYKELKKLAQQGLDDFGGDSSTYQAVEDFNNSVKQKAVYINNLEKVLPFHLL